MISDKKTETVDIKLEVDFGGMPTEAAQQAADDIRRAFSKFGRPHIKFSRTTAFGVYDTDSKSREVEVTTRTIGNTSIGEAIVAAIGTTWHG